MLTGVSQDLGLALRRPRRLRQETRFRGAALGTTICPAPAPRPTAATEKQSPDTRTATHTSEGSSSGSSSQLCKLCSHFT
eukprot:6281520-Prymnesium_polylepis.1